MQGGGGHTSQVQWQILGIWVIQTSFLCLHWVLSPPPSPTTAAAAVVSAAALRERFSERPFVCRCADHASHTERERERPETESGSVREGGRGVVKRAHITVSKFVFIFDFCACFAVAWVKLKWKRAFDECQSQNEQNRNAAATTAAAALAAAIVGNWNWNNAGIEIYINSNWTIASWKIKVNQKS